MAFKVVKMAHWAIPFGLNLKLSELTLYSGLLKHILRGEVPEELQVGVARGTAYIGYKDAKIVGWAFYQPAIGSAHQCLDIFVDPKFRKKGFGKKIAAAVVKDADKWLPWDVEPFDEAGKALYGSVGIEAEIIVKVEAPSCNCGACTTTKKAIDSCKGPNVTP